MTEIDTMTDDELRAAIAEALGADMEFNPDWPRDVAAALALMTPGATLTHLEDDVWQCGGDFSRPTTIPVYATADTPARAICRWWLRWKEQEREG